MISYYGLDFLIRNTCYVPDFTVFQNSTQPPSCTFNVRIIGNPNGKAKIEENMQIGHQKGFHLIVNSIEEAKNTNSALQLKRT